MATDQQFCLRWNNHQSTLISVFDTLLENGTLVDCTLAAEGQYLKAHKVVLSACSPYLEALLSQHYEKHPIVILKDVKFTELKSMMDYMYRGEVNISQDQLATFLKAAESLQIKGLSDNGDDARDVGSTAPKRPDPPPPRPAVAQPRAPVEAKRPAPPGDLSDASRDGSISPSSIRKRRRTRRPSQGDDPDLDTTNNSCDLPNQAQSTPLPVPSSTVVPSPVQSLPKQIVKQEPISRLDTSVNSVPPESGLLKEKIEPPSEPLLEPKTEYLDYMNNENSIEVEDLTLDDDDEDLDSSMDTSRPGPSHGDMSNQGYPPWNMTGDQSGTDEFLMAAQEAVGSQSQQQRDSQGDEDGTGVVADHEEEFEQVFVSASFLQVKPTDLFFSELNHSQALEKQKSTTNSEGGLCLGRETEQFKRVPYPDGRHSYGTRKKLINSSKACQESCCADDKGQTKVLSVKHGIGRPQKKRDGQKLKKVNIKMTANERRKYLSSRGRKRKLLQWSGDSFHVKELKTEPVTKANEENDEINIEGNGCSTENTSTKLENSTSHNNREKRITSNKQKINYKYLYYPYSRLNQMQQNRTTKFKRQSLDSKCITPVGQISNKKLNYKERDTGRYARSPGCFKCNNCGANYTYLRSLQRHQTYACGTEPKFPCPFCSYRAIYKIGLKTHISRYHQEMYDEWYSQTESTNNIKYRSSM